MGPRMCFETENVFRVLLKSLSETEVLTTDYTISYMSSGGVFVVRVKAKLQFFSINTFFESMPRFLKTLNTNPKTTHTKCKTLYTSCKRQLCFQNSVMSPQKGTLLSNDKHSPLYE